MLRIRLSRVGKRGQPSYRIVVMESASPRDGAYIDWIGDYQPLVNPPKVVLDQEKAKSWLKKGAQPSEAVERILKWQGVVGQEAVAVKEA